MIFEIWDLNFHDVVYDPVKPKTQPKFPQSTFDLTLEKIASSPMKLPLPVGL